MAHEMKRLAALNSLLALTGCFALELLVGAAPAGLRLATFDVDATPPIGSFMAYDPVTNKWELGLRARGVVLLGAGEPIVLCAFDWIGIANESHDTFQAVLARAAGTSPQRVAVHTLHQHDAPDSDFSAERLLKNAGLDARQYEGRFQRGVLTNLAEAIQTAIPRAQPVSALGLGEARVSEVASSRRILGPDGKVKAVRYTSCQDPSLRAEPEGTIDPTVSLVSFWNGEQPLAVLSYFATHPQSYYRTGIPNPDFPGVARFLRQLAVPSALHVHFNGAGGNIGAGKYNDGAPANRRILAERLADGMRRAWENSKREPITADAVTWAVERVALPPSKHLSDAQWEAFLSRAPQAAPSSPSFVATGGPSRMAWLKRCQDGHRLEVACLRLGRCLILHMPGELFVEYQLAAKAERPNRFVAMAAYGDYAPWYIGTAIAYEQGGYETSPSASNVGPEAEAILMGAIKTVMRAVDVPH